MPTVTLIRRYPLSLFEDLFLQLLLHLSLLMLLQKCLLALALFGCLLGRLVVISCDRLLEDSLLLLLLLLLLSMEIGGCITDLHMLTSKS